MKKLILSLMITVLFFSCKNDKTTAQIEDQNVAENETDSLPTIASKDINAAVIYEANIRQYSPEGKFTNFTQDIPQLKELGVKIIWLMPVFPISETKRKATGGDFASKLKDEAERKKMLGSYYAVTDFTKINPEFGSIEDFRNLVKTAHDNGMFVILDWVPNHTGWDHIWIKNNPEYYTKNEKGEITDPLNPDGSSVGWGDVADLNYENMELRKEMIEDMQYWLKDEGVDGFRCDVAGSVPTDFWADAIPKLRATKNIFMLAEANEPELFEDDLFDMGYGWDGHHLMNAIAQGKKNADDFYVYLDKVNSDYEKDDILMNFITNHDENSWNGTIKERMGDAAPALLALEYMTPGMPLIYSGMEYDLDHRLKFFEKDSIPKTKATMYPLLEKLGALKNTNSALSSSRLDATINRVETKNKNVLVFSRENNGSKVTYVANLSNKDQTFETMPKGDYLDYMTNEKVTYKTKPVTLKPWEYKLLVQ